MSNYTVTLPSRGQIYKDKEGNSTCPDGLITLGPLKMKEQAIFANKSTDNTKKLDEVLKRVILEPAIDPAKMLVSDRLYLLFAMRTNTLGSEYQVSFRCDHCEAQQRFTLDLVKDLKVKYTCLSPDELPVSSEYGDLTDPLVPYLTSTFDIDLPNGSKVTARLLTGEDEFAVSTYQKRTRTQTNAPGDPSLFYRLALMITKVNDVELPILERIKMVENWDLRTSNAFSDALEAREPGVNLTIQRDCTSCGAGNEFPLTFTAEFFRPRAR